MHPSMLSLIHIWIGEFANRWQRSFVDTRKSLLAALDASSNLVIFMRRTHGQKLDNLSNAFIMRQHLP